MVLYRGNRNFITDLAPQCPEDPPDILHAVFHLRGIAPCKIDKLRFGEWRVFALGGIPYIHEEPAPENGEADTGAVILLVHGVRQIAIQEIDQHLLGGDLEA